MLLNKLRFAILILAIASILSVLITLHVFNLSQVSKARFMKTPEQDYYAEKIPASNSKTVVSALQTNKIVEDFKTEEFLNTPANKTKKNEEESNCLILIWCHEDMEIEIPKHELCGGGCEITWDKSRFDEARAVIIEMKWMYEVKHLPDIRQKKRNQIFIWLCRESTWTTRFFYGNPLNYHNYFNWTMTFRLDSDVDGTMIPFTAAPFVNYMWKQRLESFVGKITDLRRETINEYAEICERRKLKGPPPMPDVSKKTKMAVWFATDCSTTKSAVERVQLIKDLISKGLIVGGNSVCLSSSKKSKFASMTEMLDNIATHKFYLAFENGFHCLNYITEKLWLNSLYAGTVPVVWGAKKEDYEIMAPPKSFIHVEDFNSTADLISYLKYLDKNDTAYMEYFEWRKLYPCNYPLHTPDDEEFPYSTESKFSIFFSTYCNLCKMLKRPNLKSKMVSSLRNYWFDDEEQKCLPPSKGQFFDFLLGSFARVFYRMFGTWLI